jgi:hypothetical protein
MPLPNQQRTDYIVQTSWASGMITSLPPEELPEDAAALIENFEFDDIGNLKSRYPVRSTSDGSLDLGNTTSLSSIFVANFSDGIQNIYVTRGTDLYRTTGGVPGTALSSLTGAFTFPNGNRWYWLMFQDFAVGINGSVDNNNNPIKITSGNVVTKLDSAGDSHPAARHGVVWNNRLWLSGLGSNSSTIYGSAINDITSWTPDGTDDGPVQLLINDTDGDEIYALSVFRGNMIVYKRNHIYIVSAVSAPATIPSNLRVDLYAQNIGCVYADTIKNVLDDQVFLSPSGVASLSLATLGDVRGAILSDNIAELSSIPTVLTGAINSSATAHNLVQKRQYFLALPNNLTTLTDGNVVWVMDYSDIQQRDIFGNPKVRWCKFTGDIFGTAYATEFRVSQIETYLVGVPAGILSTNAVLGWYTPIGEIADYTDAGILTSKVLLTRAFHGASPLVRSLWHRFGLSFIRITDTVSYTVFYYFDNFLSNSAGNYSFTDSTPASQTNRFKWRTFKKNDSGRKANLVQLRITANTIDQAMTIKGIHLEFTPLTHRRANTSWVSD